VILSNSVSVWTSRWNRPGFFPEVHLDVQEYGLAIVACWDGWKNFKIGGSPGWVAPVNPDIAPVCGVLGEQWCAGWVQVRRALLVARFKDMGTSSALRAGQKPTKRHHHKVCRRSIWYHTAIPVQKSLSERTGAIFGLMALGMASGLDK